MYGEEDNYNIHRKGVWIGNGYGNGCGNEYNYIYGHGYAHGYCAGVGAIYDCGYKIVKEQTCKV